MKQREIDSHSGSYEQTFSMQKGIIKNRLSNKPEIILQVWKGYRRQARSNPTVTAYQNPCTLACTDYGYR